MGRPKRPYPFGSYRLRVRGEADPDKTYTVELIYTWNRRLIQRAMNIFVKESDWNPKANNGRGGVKYTFGKEAARTNNLLTAHVDKMDGLLAEYHHRYPNQLTEKVIGDILDGKPVLRADKGRDLGEFAMERLESEYSRNRIGRSRYQNGKSGLNVFKEFLRSKGLGTHKPDGIYIGELTPELIDELIEWRRTVKQNEDTTINHGITPLLKASAYAAESGMIDPMVNARIQEMRIVIKKKIGKDDEPEFDGKYLTMSEMSSIIDYHWNCKEPRRKEFLEMFMFAFHACGMRVVDVMTLQWSHINFERRELRKIMIKTNKRHVIPLTDAAIKILRKWEAQRQGKRFVFDLVKESLDLDDDDALYRARTNATKCINQSLIVVGEQLKLKFPLTMHVARHSFAVTALNGGLSMSVVSRLLGHGSTDVTEKVYAKFLPETLAAEIGKIGARMNSLDIIE